jgi:hypothetical protein
MTERASLKKEKTMYILDTSALKGIGRTKLELIKQRHDLAISPMTFHELLCHLDEIDDDMTFERQKGIIMKCQLPRILHDPFAYHALTVGARDITNPSRFEEPTMIPQLLERLRDAKTLDVFYGTEVDYPDGSVGSCKDVSKRVREVLDEEERKYLEHQSVMRKELETNFPEWSSSGITPQQMGGYIASSLKNLITSYRNEDRVPGNLLATKVTSSMYMHIGYNAFRAIDYMMASRGHEEPITPDPNDCEDSYIAIHLELFKRDILVTEDKGTINALRRTSEAFHRFVSDKMQIESRVLSNDEFLAETMNTKQCDEGQ